MAEQTPGIMDSSPTDDSLVWQVGRGAGASLFPALFGFIHCGLHQGS
jgi:hypothetical protein